MGLRNYIFGWRSFGIRPEDTVLEVGSGNRPIARSDVLCDLGKYGAEERYDGNMPHDTVIDRPFVYADAAELPFHDNAFDFLISAHMLEHLPSPQAFLQEAGRISKRGVIITPSPSFEKMFAETSHLWYISIDDGVLTLFPKEKGDEGCFGKLFQDIWETDWHLRRLIWNRTNIFETRYFYANGKISYKVYGEPDIPSSYKNAAINGQMPSGCGPSFASYFSSGLRSFLGRMIRKTSSNAKVDLYSFLRCLNCHGSIHRSNQGRAICAACNLQYTLDKAGAPVMLRNLAE